MRWLAFLVAFVILFVMTTASFPGPWHEHEEGPNQDCQCPVCKIAHHGLLHFFAALLLHAPVFSVFLVSAEQAASQLDAFVFDQAARAPPA